MTKTVTETVENEETGEPEEVEKEVEEEVETEVNHLLLFSSHKCCLEKLDNILSFYTFFSSSNRK